MKKYEGTNVPDNVTFKMLCVKDGWNVKKGEILVAINGIFTYSNGRTSAIYSDFKELIRQNPIFKNVLIEIKDGDDINEILKKYDSNEEKPDYWSRVCEIQKRQTDKGLKKYGQVLEDTPNMNISTRLNHIEEELIDALMYIEHLKELLK